MWENSCIFLPSLEQCLIKAQMRVNRMKPLELEYDFDFLFKSTRNELNH